MKRFTLFQVFEDRDGKIKYAIVSSVEADNFTHADILFKEKSAYDIPLKYDDIKLIGRTILMA
jgi:hypothetical protein